MNKQIELMIIFAIWLFSLMISNTLTLLAFFICFGLVGWLILFRNWFIKDNIKEVNK